MAQEFSELDALVRKRIRGLRLAMGWSLDELAARCYLSASTLSRIETGARRISLDQLASLARALDTSLDQLVQAGTDEDVILRPRPDSGPGVTSWALGRDPAVTVARMRITRPAPTGPADLKAHPGREWFTVLSGTIVLLLGDRRILVDAGQAAEFYTMTPHAIGAQSGAAEILGIFDRDAQRTHLRPES
ncbi:MULTISPECIES: helix-turn-helix domain-containing protein [Kitasatospora]|uniref:helix-turn-helix domain-containing protein n=1 Tax=Kitasatospora TaxID=2063 RepID=UPI000C705C7B|nr:XRE family transcriptional regulator [Kitasatospora sp. GP30]MDH6143721.1 transcriptional regulator with XRE-family HTH domain [Kitasatospora sp. GP30]